MTTATIGTCRDCEGTENVENGLCDECAAHYIYCDICSEDQHEDDMCRHVYWSEFWAEHAGAGHVEYCGHDHHREPIRKLLDACGFKFASWLYRALCFDRLCLGFWGSMLGPMTVENNHIGRDFRFSSVDIFRDHDIDTDGWELGGPEEAAVFWLTSLWPDVDQPRWDTVRWIREWMEQNETPGEIEAARKD